MSYSHVAVEMDDASRVGEARRTAARLGELGGMSKIELGKIAVIVTELATNLIKHATKGQLLLRCFRSSDLPCFEAISVDSGPGISDVQRSFADGYSTSGTMGGGLGALRRMSDSFEVYSVPEAGSVFVSRVGGPPAREPAWEHRQAGLTSGCVSLPLHGEDRCGDTWRFVQSDGRAAIMVADGLGHGPGAADAADLAASVFEESPFLSPKDFLEKCHPRLRATRGAAVSCVSIDTLAGVMRNAGVGNIAGSLINGSEQKGIISQNGTVGSIMPRVQEISYPWARTSQLVLASDGLQTRWKLDSYPGFQRTHPALLASLLYRDSRRPRDDVTVLVITGQSNGATV